MLEILFKTYFTVGATLGVILAGPIWQGVLEERGLPSSWGEVEPMLAELMLATGHGFIRMYGWLPSFVYYIGFQGASLQHWLFACW
jgi:hypothetical protein